MDDYNNKGKYIIQMNHTNSRNTANSYLEVKLIQNETLFHCLEIKLKTRGKFSKPKRDPRRIDSATEDYIRNQVRKRQRLCKINLIQF